jgi:hypothetical protein
VVNLATLIPVAVATNNSRHKNAACMRLLSSKVDTLHVRDDLVLTRTFAIQNGVYRQCLGVPSLAKARSWDGFREIVDV